MFSFEPTQRGIPPMNCDALVPSVGFAKIGGSEAPDISSIPIPQKMGSPHSGTNILSSNSQNRRQRGFDASLVPVLAIRSDSELLEANAAASAWLKTSLPCETPVYLEQLLPQKERGAFRLFVQKVLEASGIQRCELRISPDGLRTELVELRGILADEGKEIWITAIVQKEEHGAKDQLLDHTDYFEDIPAAIVITDAKGRIQWVNRAFVEMTGYRLEETINLRPGAFLQGPGSDPAVVAKMRTFLANRWPFEVEILNYHKSGISYWVQLNVNPVPNKRGDITHFFAVQTNISKRKLAEFELTKLESFNRTLLESIPSLVAFWSRDLRCEYGNLRYREWFGISDDSFLGKSMPEVVGAALFQKNEHFIRGALEGRVQGFERDIETAAGELRSTWTQYVPRNVAGQVEGFLVLITDITHLKEIERASQQSNLRLRGILETMQTGLVIADFEGRITEVNPAAGRILGLTDNEIVGRTSLDANWRCVREDGTSFPGDEHPAMRVLHTGQSIHDVIMGVGMKDESLKWITINSSPMAGPDGHKGCVTIFSDITGLKQSEERYRKARDVAEAANRAKTQFLAMMSHELRTPMNGLLGFAQLLKMTELTAEQSKYTEMLETSGEALLAVLNDILDMSRVEAGKIEVELKMFDLRTIIEEVVILNSHRAREKELKLILDFHPGDSDTVFADSGRVRQVLLNLLGNAVKFTLLGEIKVAVAPGEAGYTKVSIIDTGIGIPLEKQHLLFKPFSQMDASTTRKYGGSGLGLALCKELVELMGGCIGCVSEAGKGSTFWLTLPRNPPRVGEEHPGLVMGQSISAKVV